MRIEYPERANEAVRRIQTMLDKIDLFEGQVDGSWGPVTRQALAAYSRRIGFAADSPNPSSVESASDGVITNVIVPDELLAELESEYNSRIEAESQRYREREERLRAEQERLRTVTVLPPLKRRTPDSSGSLVLPVLVGGALVGLALWLSTRRRQSLIPVTEIDSRMRADEVQF
jgi:peptidoglycan hydrolase-like protein with peptidoglycan-binding domain